MIGMQLNFMAISTSLFIFFALIIIGMKKKKSGLTSLNISDTPALELYSFQYVYLNGDLFF